MRLLGLDLRWAIISLILTGCLDVGERAAVQNYRAAHDVADSVLRSTLGLVVRGDTAGIRAITMDTSVSGSIQTDAEVHRQLFVEANGSLKVSLFETGPCASTIWFLFGESSRKAQGLMDLRFVDGRWYVARLSLNVATDQ